MTIRVVPSMVRIKVIKYGKKIVTLGTACHMKFKVTKSYQFTSRSNDENRERFWDGLWLCNEATSHLRKFILFAFSRCETSKCSGLVV